MVDYCKMVIDVNDILVRASGAYQLMTEPKTNKAKEAGELSETAKTYLGKLFRSYKYQRVEDFESKYTEKGKTQEEAAIDLVSITRKKFFRKNTKRLYNAFLTGEPDLFVGKDITEAEEGIDTKVSWSIWTFPFEEKTLAKQYEYQNLSYMDLTGAKKWTTSYCLVNAPANLILREKEKLWYNMDCPDDSNDRYIEKCCEIEKNMIFDMKEFLSVPENRGFSFSIKDWKYDIPASERIKDFVTERDEEKIAKLHEAVIRGREYIKNTFLI